MLKPIFFSLLIISFYTEAGVLFFLEDSSNKFQVIAAFDIQRFLSPAQHDQEIPLQYRARVLIDCNKGWVDRIINTIHDEKVAVRSGFNRSKIITLLNGNDTSVYRNLHVLEYVNQKDLLRKIPLGQNCHQSFLECGGYLFTYSIPNSLRTEFTARNERANQESYLWGFDNQFFDIYGNEYQMYHSYPQQTVYVVVNNTRNLVVATFGMDTENSKFFLFLSDEYYFCDSKNDDDEYLNQYDSPSTSPPSNNKTLTGVLAKLFMQKNGSNFVRSSDSSKRTLKSANSWLCWLDLIYPQGSKRKRITHDDITTQEQLRSNLLYLWQESLVLFAGH